jgi:hypothetical protein
MSIQSEIDRINNAKTSIKSAISSKGVSVPSDASIEDLPALVRSIPQEGGGSESNTMRVTFDFDLASMQARNPSHTSTEIADAFESGVIVQGVFSFIEPTLGVPASLAAPLSVVTRISGLGDIVVFHTTTYIGSNLVYIDVQVDPTGILTSVKPLATLS